MFKIKPIDRTVFQADKVFLAVLFCLLSHFLFAVMGACAKYLAQTHHVIEIAFYRNLIAIVPFFLFIVMSKNTHLFKTQKPKLVAFRAITGGVSIILTFGALSLLPMSYATVLFFTSSMLTPVLAFFVLKEHVGIHRWSAVIIGMCGVMIIAQPSGTLSLLGLILALISAALHGVMYITLRSLRSEPPITIAFYLTLAGIIIPGLGMPWFGSGVNVSEFPVFFLIALSGVLGQLCLTTAYKYAPASLITPFAYSALLWSTLLDIYWWRYDNLDLHAVYLGAVLIMGAQIYILYREYINRQKNAVQKKWSALHETNS